MATLPRAYAPTHGAVDEAFDGGGAVRAAYRGVLDGVDTTERIARAVEYDGIIHGAGDAAHPFGVDAVPRVFAADEWAALAAGLEQRVAALEAFVADVFGAREAFRAGVVPEDLLDECPWHEPGLAALPAPASWIGVAGPDVVRDADGELVVLEDNVRTPTLMGFALAARRLVGDVEPRDALPIEAPLRDALLAIAGDGAVAILGRDEGNYLWWELEELSRLTGWPLVGLGDLDVRGDRVVVRDSGAPVDVLWRRTAEERVLGDDGRPNALGELLLGPLRAGTVRVVNAFGTGVADDKRTFPYVEDLVRFYTGAEPLLRSIPSWDLGTQDGRAAALDRLEELVVKPRTGSGGFGVVLGPHASPEELAELRRAVERDPSSFIAQEPVALSTHPTVIDGALEPRHVDLRPFVVGGRVLPGGLSRFAIARGDLVVNCSQGGGGKDVRVLPA